MGEKYLKRYKKYFHDSDIREFDMQHEQWVFGGEEYARPVLKVIDEIIHVKNDLAMFTVQAVSRGIDALGEVTVRIKSSDGGTFSGRAADGDIIVASAKAYLDALNRLLIKVRGEEIEIS